jgi:hypothetical protein
MSNYDPNTAVSRAIGIDLTTVDVGLRAYMLRIHNHMAAGVGLTNLGTWLTYQFTGPELLPNPLMWVFRRGQRTGWGTSIIRLLRRGSVVDRPGVPCHKN